MEVELIEEPLARGMASRDNAEPHEIVVITLSGIIEDGRILTLFAVDHDDLLQRAELLEATCGGANIGFDRHTLETTRDLVPSRR